MSEKTPKTTSGALAKFGCQVDDFNNEISKIFSVKRKGDLYKKFIEKFLTYIPVDYRSHDKIQFFEEFTHTAFDFFKVRENQDRKIEIKKSKFNGNPSLTILVLTDNKPFIIDSLACLLSKMGLQVLFTFHPVISCSRDKKGHLTEILSKGEEGHREALVFVKIIGSFNQDKIKLIESEINNIINLVSYTYDSWQTLLNKLISITTGIVHSKEIYEEMHLPAEETLDFLNWLQKNNFTFLGMLEYDAKNGKILSEEGVKEIWKDNSDEIKTIIDHSNTEESKHKLAMLGNLNKISPVHRNSLVDYILIKQLDDDGVYKKGTIIFGLYGRAIYYQSIKSVPILRGKMNYVLDASDFPPNGYFAKRLKNIIESLPREILIQIDEEDLYCMCLNILSAMDSKLFKLFIQEDRSKSFLNMIMFMPRERLTPDAYKKINNYVQEKFGCKIIFDDITVLAQEFAHVFITLAVEEGAKFDFALEEVQEDLIQLTTNWSESLTNALTEKYGEYEGGLRYRQIEPVIPAEYRYKYGASEAISDIEYITSASKLHKIMYNLQKGEGKRLTLKIYSPQTPMTLSDILPAIENLGFTAIDESSFHISSFDDVKEAWIYEFILESPIDIENFDQLKHNIEEALDKMAAGVLTSDTLSKLLVMGGFDWMKVKLIKALSRYLHQTGFTYGKGYVQLTLVKHYAFTKMLVELFTALFHPDKVSSKVIGGNLKGLKDNHEKENQDLDKKILDYIDGVESSAEDKVLRHMHAIIKAIVRTNFFQSDDGKICGGCTKDYISFKFSSAKVPELPLPLPFAEIFVYSHDFEAIHLRGGRVARGGLRWSDRGEDYRTEVLGLMKAQMTKNTVIVPEGCKGAFHVNIQQGDMSREDYMGKVVSCYQDFLRGLLDLTDNLVNGKVVHPSNTVIYDIPNPYLVVAADKGTATFSDFANDVSSEYNFWLGDAFASGGSVGYDHKKMGITAKGAWVSVRTHFMQMGIDIQKEPVTVVGIGDMSGDVFGNGMLLSKAIKLVAAFNHMHIFIDPDPDPSKSYKERQRLFKMPRSKWTDYNAALISKGGGIFDRSHKTLEISPEIKDLLGIKESKMAPDKLINAILKAEVGLIWNGGIGTYVKASTENNIDIGDKTNDVLRVNGEEVRAKVIGEGGNLGLSQLGRIEYALKGGKANTDFIDNSAGVDCSDHEVNIKIALRDAVMSKKISASQRDKTLEGMTCEVEDLVLRDNHVQNLALTINEHSEAFSLESFTQLMKDLERDGLLDREVEFLPDSTELSRRSVLKQNLTRPELSVLLSYSKMLVDKELKETEISKDPYFDRFLQNYFPVSMHKKFAKEIANHPLKNEIISTVVTNKLVNQLGGPLINELRSETGGLVCDIARAHMVVCEIFELDCLWEAVSDLPVSVHVDIKMEMLSDMIKMMRRGISWFIRNEKHPIDILSSIKSYQEQTLQVRKMSSSLLVGEAMTKFQNKKNKFIEAGISEDIADQVAQLDILVSTFDILYIAKLTKSKGDRIANLYFSTGELLKIDWLRKSCDSFIDDSYWKRLSIQSIKDDLYDKQRRLIIRMIELKANALKKTKSSKDPASKLLSEDFDLMGWLDEYRGAASIFVDFVHNIKIQETLDLNMLILATKKFELFLRKLN